MTSYQKAKVPKKVSVEKVDNQYQKVKEKRHQLILKLEFRLIQKREFNNKQILIG